MYKPIFLPTKVVVRSALTELPIIFPFSPDKPDGISKDKTGVEFWLINSIAFKKIPSTDRLIPIPKIPSTIKSQLMSIFSFH